MFDFKYKKHNYIYNNLVKLARNLFFYTELGFKDKPENRVIIIFGHLSIILAILKNNKKYEILSQEIYDNVFLNIENSLREMGHGDVTVNKKMKQFNQIFHDILIKFVDKKNNKKIFVNELIKFLYTKDKNDKIIEKLHIYFEKYHHFCFDIINKNMIKDIIKFKY